jgi:sarcosine oxidase
MQQYDVIVVGLGAMGAATLWRLAQAGARVLGVETGGPVHRNGSSHGATRIFRRAYFEGTSYLPLLSLAHAGWQELQATTPRRLTHATGGVFIGPRNSELVAGSVHTARAGNIEHAHWDTAALRSHLPQFGVEEGMHALFEPGAYALASEAARLQMLDESVRHGAEIRYGTSAVSIEHSAAGLGITNRAGVTTRCKSVVMTAGAWMSELLPELATHLHPQHVAVYWFEPRPGCEARFTAEALPVFVYECSDGAQLYGVPAGTGERGVKIGLHNRQRQPWSDAPKPALHAGLRAEIAHYATRIVPELAPEPIDAQWCIYTLSPDGSFLIGAAQRIPGVYYASVCSGHGFKFAPAIGSVLAALALGEPPPVPIDAFSAARFT